MAPKTRLKRLQNLKKKHSGGLTPPSPSKEYLDQVGALDDAIRGSIDVSQQYSGITSPTSQHLYASVLFTMLCTRGVSLAILTPRSSWAKKVIDHWDYASIAGLTRSILETRLTFYYLCIETLSDEAWDCRWNVFNLHDCVSRRRLFSEMGSETNEISGFNRQAEELRRRLLSNSYFISLPEKQRSRFLRGRDAYICSLEDIAEKVGIDRQSFRWFYQFLSNQIHALPMSFYRMHTAERGRGVHSDIEENYTWICISEACSLILDARDEMRQLFKGLKAVPS